MIVSFLLLNKHRELLNKKTHPSFNSTNDSCSRPLGAWTPGGW